VHARGDEPGNVRDVRDEDRADFVRHLTKGLKIQRARVCARAHPEQLGLVLFGERPDFIHVDAAVALAHAVRHALEILSADRHCVPRA